MKNKAIKIVCAAAAIFAVAQVTQASPIVGYIGFHGNVTLDSGSVNTATEAVSWNGVVVGGSDGSFSSVNVGDSVLMSSSGWFFNSIGGGGIVEPFWSVGDFSFDLITSTIVSQGYGFLNIVISGTVSAAGYDTTSITGAFTAVNPPSGGGQTFGMAIAFGDPVPSVPDGGMTVMLLGGALAGVGFLKRKLTV